MSMYDPLPGCIRRSEHAKQYTQVLDPQTQQLARQGYSSGGVWRTPAAYRRLLGNSIWMRGFDSRWIQLRLGGQTPETQGQPHQLVEMWHVPRHGLWTRNLTRHEDLRDAVDAANAAHVAFHGDTGHLSHMTCGVGIQDWVPFGRGMRSFDRRPLDADVIIRALYDAEQRAARAAELQAYAENAGLVTSS